MEKRRGVFPGHASTQPTVRLATPPTHSATRPEIKRESASRLGKEKCALLSYLFSYRALLINTGEITPGAAFLSLSLRK